MKKLLLYNLLYFSRLYDEQDAFLNPTEKRNWQSAIADVQALKKQYPSLDTQEIIQSLKELEKEHYSNNPHSLHQKDQSRNIFDQNINPALIANPNFNNETGKLISQFVNKNPTARNNGILAKDMFNLIINQKGSIEQKVSSLAHLAEICNNYASIYSHNNLDKKSKQILQLTADYILNNPHLNRSEKLKCTSQILAKSQSLFPDDKESRRAIITNMNRTLKTKIPLAQQNTQNLLQTLQSAQETSLNNQNNKIQMPFNNSKDIA